MKRLGRCCGGEIWEGGNCKRRGLLERSPKSFYYYYYYIILEGKWIGQNLVKVVADFIGRVI